MLTERLFDTGKVVLNIAEGTTDGPPLLLLHGSTMNWQSFSEFLPTLEQGWHVYALDFRGHGKSEWTQSAYHVANYVQDVVDVIEHVIAQPVVVMGYSLGGTVTLAVAARLSRVVRAIVPLDPGLIFRDTSLRSAPVPHQWIYEYIMWLTETLKSARSFEELVVRCKAGNPDLDDRSAQAWAAELQSLDPRMVTDMITMHDDLAFEQILPQINCPTLMVRGDPALGGIVRDSDVAFLQKHVPQSRTIQIPNVGHGIASGQAGALALEHAMKFLGTL